VRSEYTRASGGPAVSVQRPCFRRVTDERRRLATSVINYGGHATNAYIQAQFDHANLRWNQIGIQIDAGAPVVRPIPPAALDGTGRYPRSLDNPQEVAALSDLIPITADNMVAVIFVPIAAADVCKGSKQ
jgi:hypothetical protein